MRRSFQAAFAVQPGEGGRIGWLLLHSLFLGVFAAFYFSAASGLFLARFGAEILPVAYLVSGLVGYATIGLFSLLERRVSRFALFLAQLGFLVALTGALWGASRLTGSRWVAFALFVWIVPSLTLLNLEFWGLASRLFDLRQGKRLFGLVSTGESVSAILGYILVPLLLEYIFDDPIYLLPLAGTGLLACILVVLLMKRRFPAELTSSRETAAGQTPEVHPDLWRSRYFVLIAGLVVLAVLAHYFLDFSFLSEVRMRFQGAESVASFMAVFFGLLKVIELPLRGFFAGRLLASFGLRTGLALLPLALLLCTAGAAVAGALLGERNGLFFLFVVLGKMLWMALRRAIFDPSVRVLYQPLDEGERLAVQTRVEGLVQQLGIGLAGALLLAFTRGSFGPLAACLVLLPLLAALLLLAGVLHREYRERLLHNLSRQNEGPSASTPAADPLDRLRRLPEAAKAAALDLVARVDPAAAAALAREWLSDPSDAVRLAALEHVSRTGDLGAQEEVQRLTTGDASIEVRTAAIHILLSLCELQTVASSAAGMAALARAPLPESRRRAAIALGGAKGQREPLRLLLWDRDREVRRAAIVSAGRTGHLEFRHRILDHLSDPALSGTAAAAASALGEEIIPDLETAYGRAATPEAKTRILKICQRIHGTRARRFLFERLDSPDRSLQLQATLSLEAGGFRAEPDRIDVVKRRIEDLVEIAAWSLAALLDLAGEPAAAEVRRSIRLDLQGYRRTLYRLTSLLYDPQAIRLVRENLERGDREAEVYALEIMDLLVSPDLKAIILPLMERIPPAQCLSRLESFAPQTHVGRVERLCAILHRERGSLSTWTRVCALRALGELSERVTDDLIAYLFHPDPLLQEAAAGIVVRLDPAAWARHSRKLPPAVREKLEALVHIRGDEDPALSRFQKALILREAGDFGRLPREVLLQMAGFAEERRLAPGERLFSSRDPRGSVYVLLRTPVAVLAPDPQAPPVSEEVRLLCLNGDHLLELMATWEQAIPVFLHLAAHESRNRAAEPEIAPEWQSGAFAVPVELGVSAAAS